MIQYRSWMRIFRMKRPDMLCAVSLLVCISLDRRQGITAHLMGSLICSTREGQPGSWALQLQ